MCFECTAIMNEEDDHSYSCLRDSRSLNESENEDTMTERGWSEIVLKKEVKQSNSL